MQFASVSDDATAADSVFPSPPPGQTTETRSVSTSPRAALLSTASVRSRLGSSVCGILEEDHPDLVHLDDSLREEELQDPVQDRTTSTVSSRVSREVLSQSRRELQAHSSLDGSAVKSESFTEKTETKVAVSHWFPCHYLNTQFFITSTLTCLTKRRFGVIADLLSEKRTGPY